MHCEAGIRTVYIFPEGMVRHDLAMIVRTSGAAMNDSSDASTLGQSAYARLRQMILAGALPAGTRLQEQALAERLGVSRTPVREAIGRLHAEGLVARPSGGAPVVHRITVSEVMEILHVRRLLECDAARQAALAPHLPVEGLLELRSVFRGFCEGERPTPEEHIAFDDRLHRLIAQTCGSNLLSELIETLKLKTRMFDKGSIPERFEPGCREHIEIIDAVLARDGDRAAAAMHVHLEGARAGIIAHLSRLF
ncbi:GntR family transcriptional regulator [Pararhodobacter sp. SW119]|uniref:GntR family transcriptional regulator n=1 Tax=Pararhodobacter sp. SW119 TaxID=2780075 RepID=UPI001FD7984E|nr:GntR family transcriptional regulator [Pararhodobacter sp. SW119]